jgi:TATA-box binding protein (TBP) (component of TFIID and TFIIIB)
MTFAYKISTITLSSTLDGCELNLFNIANWIPIDDTIIGVAYNDIIRGSLSKRSGFYNQMTLIISHNGKSVNVKVFNNGTLNMTGCKSESDGREIHDKFLGYLRNWNPCVTLPVVTLENGIYIVRHGGVFVYSCKFKRIIGEYKDDKYIINRAVFDLVESRFIACKDFTKKRVIYDKDGVLCGYLKPIYTCGRLYKNAKANLVLQGNDIVANGNIIGRITEGTVEGAVEGAVEGDHSTYDISPFSSLLSEIPETHINCINISFNIGYKLNRSRLFEALSQTCYTVYNPDVYSGVMLKYPTQSGHVTFLIFQSGNVILGGLKSIESIDGFLRKFQLVMEQVKDTCILKPCISF